MPTAPKILHKTKRTTTEVSKIFYSRASAPVSTDLGMLQAETIYAYKYLVLEAIVNSLSSLGIWFEKTEENVIERENLAQN